MGPRQQRESAVAHCCADIATAEFVALDLEFSGLFLDVDDRGMLGSDYYTRCITSIPEFLPLQLGLCCAHRSADSPNAWELRVHEFNLWPCKRLFVSDFKSLQFLREHGFDFNAFLEHGFAFSRLDFDKTKRPRRKQDANQLIRALRSAGVPLVVHNGLLDLLHLHHGFIGDLPKERLAELQAELPAGWQEVHQLAEHWGVSIYRQARTDFGAGGRKRFGGVKGARRRVVEIKEDLAKVQYAAEDAPNGNEMKDAELERPMVSQELLKSHELCSRFRNVLAIVGEIAKHREQKDECLRFKDFLVNLTPAEWKEQKREEKKQRKLHRRRIAVDARMGEIEERMQAEIEAEEQAFKEKEEKEKKGRRRQKKSEEDEQKERDQMEARRRRIARKYPTRDQVDAEYQEYSSGEEMPLYFQEPKQLLDIFTSLEESNLFLIQNSQESTTTDTEQALEELDQKFAVLKRTREAMSNKMHLQISQLERQIFEEKSKCDELKQAISQKHGGSEVEDGEGLIALVFIGKRPTLPTRADRYDFHQVKFRIRWQELLEGLAGGVVDVHGVCSHENQDDGDTLQMLARIEFKFEEYLAYLDEAEESGLGARVLAEEHKKERQRRLDLRLSRKLHQEKKIEDRLKASLHRSQAPVHKKVGKQIMFRSAPLFQARRVVQEDDGYEENVREHNIFGIWLDKDGVPNAQQPDPWKIWKFQLAAALVALSRARAERAGQRQEPETLAQLELLVQEAQQRLHQGRPPDPALAEGFGHLLAAEAAMATEDWAKASHAAKAAIACFRLRDEVAQAAALLLMGLAGFQSNAPREAVSAANLAAAACRAQRKVWMEAASKRLGHLAHWRLKETQQAAQLAEVGLATCEVSDLGDIRPGMACHDQITLGVHGFLETDPTLDSWI
eukprot:g1235.t1